MSWVLGDVSETRLSTEPTAPIDHPLTRDRPVEMDLKSFEAISVFALFFLSLFVPGHFFGKLSSCYFQTQKGWVRIPLSKLERREVFPGSCSSRYR